MARTKANAVAAFNSFEDETRPFFSEAYSYDFKLSIPLRMKRILEGPEDSKRIYSLSIPLRMKPRRTVEYTAS